MQQAIQIDQRRKLVYVDMKGTHHVAFLCASRSVHRRMQIFWRNKKDVFFLERKAPSVDPYLALDPSHKADLHRFSVMERGDHVPSFLIGQVFFSVQNPKHRSCHFSMHFHPPFCKYFTVFFRICQEKSEYFTEKEEFSFLMRPLVHDIIMTVPAKEKMNMKHTLQFDPTEYVNTLFGVDSATPAGPTMPNGSIHPSPETLEKECGGYIRNQPIVGFGQAYTSGSGGHKCYGNYLLAPMVNGIELDSAKRASFARAGSEVARCYEYRVTLENGITARVSPAHNSAIYSFTYPAGKEASFLFDVARKLDMEACMKEGSVTVDPATRSIFGGGLYSGNMNKIDWEMYFFLQFDTDCSEIGVFQEDGLLAADGKQALTVAVDPLHRLGAYVKFGTPDREKDVKVKLAISFVSVEKAKEFLDEQIPDFDSEAVKEKARAAWREPLSVIDLKSDDAFLLGHFYTAMYHMNIQPRNRTADHGTWDDFHTIWDTWKTVFPMFSLLYPNKMGQIIESFLDRAEKNKKEQNGVVVAAQYITGKECPFGQGGNDVDNAIVDAYLKGIELHRYTWQDAYAVLLRSAEMMRSPEYVERGYSIKNRMTVSGLPYSWRFYPASTTLGFALNDKAVATMARKLGTREEAEKYEARSRNWLNTWNFDLESDGFVGFPQARTPEGEFEPDFDAHTGDHKHFYEMTAWDASYVNYNDVPLMIETMGGVDTFIKRLCWACDHSIYYLHEKETKPGYLDFTNEPSFHIPWLFCTDEIRRPDLAAPIIDRIIKSFSEGDNYPDDEDNGAMSSYYVFLMCGFFPFATTENYYLHGTRVKEIVFHLENGKDFLVTGENVGEANIYVQSATWQGKPLNECKLTHKQIWEGGELHFVMGDTPSDWGQKK